MLGTVHVRGDDVELWLAKVKHHTMCACSHQAVVRFTIECSRCW